MSESTFQRAFAGGELAPVYHSRGDSPRYLEGLRRCRNFQVMRAGGVQNRSGFRFIGECKTNSSNVRLEKYVTENSGEGILVEVGSGYLRFYKDGALIELSGVTAWSNATAYEIGDVARQGGVNYYCIEPHTNQVPPNVTYWYAMPGDVLEVPTTYTTDGLIGGWEQSGNVVVITHRLHDPRELVYVSDTHWILRLADTEPSLEAPANLVLTPIAGALAYSYVVTAVKDETYEESLPSAADSDNAIAAPTAAAPHVLAWDAVTGAVEYNVYCDPADNGVYGFIGVAATNAFNNPGYEPDFSLTPPLDRTPFVSADTRPHVAAHYQQRRFYAQSNENPDGIEASRTGFLNNFGRSSPLQDDDALSLKIKGRHYHPVRHMLGLKHLIVFTDGGAWTVGEPEKPLTPSTLFADQKTYSGCSETVIPVVIGETVVYVQARGRSVRELRFSQEIEGLAGRDLSQFGSHLFDNRTVVDMDFAETPNSIVWATRSDGTLLGLTFIQEDETYGWHRHDSGASADFERVRVVPEADDDAVYVIVRRTIDGATVRYIERLERREVESFDADAFFVDSGLSYSGAPATVFAGLDHLEGESVAVLADGANVGPKTVTGGQITLSTAASNVHAGLPITAELETLDLDVGGAMIRDKQKLVKAATLIVDKSAIGFNVGPNFTDMVPARLHPWETATDENTALVEVAIASTWDKPGRICVSHTAPLPLTIIGVMPHLALGG